MYGLHFSGNYGQVNVDGFLECDKLSTRKIAENCITNRINSTRSNVRRAEDEREPEGLGCYREQLLDLQ